MKIRVVTFLLLFTGLFFLHAADTQPLKTGASIPDVALRTPEDKEIQLRKMVAEKPAVLIFYRGGWCPFCTRHLQELAGVEKELREAGFQLLAISPDRPEKLRELQKNKELEYRLLSDSDAEVINAFGISFKVDDDTVRKYKESYKIDLEADSGRTHHLLPHPAVFVVDKSGVVQFAHVNSDYKTRLEPAKILEAARKTKP